MSEYVYIKSEPGLWTVGFYQPDGTWVPESDWPSTAEAAVRVRYMNGGCRHEAARREAFLAALNAIKAEQENPSVSAEDIIRAEMLR